jgi:Zn-dependent protease
MQWSLRIGRVAGIDLYIHLTFFLVPAVLGYLAYQRSRGDWAFVFQEVAFVLVIFAIVVLHELGHALAARRYGIATRDITLLPIGGIARLERMPDDPKQELVVALAGPAVNVALALACFVALWIQGQVAVVYDLQMPLTGGVFLANLLAVNVVLVLFNMLPAFPMDGGRVLRALLALRLDYVQATRIAAAVGQGMAVLFGLAGLFLFNNLLLVVIALFVWIGADQEAGLVRMRHALAGIPVQAAMITQFRTLAPADPLSRATAHLLDGFQQDFPVVADGRVVGLLTRGDLLAALQRGAAGTVGEVMETKFETADPRELLDDVFARLQACACHSLPVLRDGELVGLVTMDNVGEFVMVQAALRGRRA